MKKRMKRLSALSMAICLAFLVYTPIAISGQAQTAGSTEGTGNAIWERESFYGAPVYELLASGGRLYAATAGSGIFVSDGGAFKYAGGGWVLFNGGMLLPAPEILSMVLSGDGTLFAGTFGKGVYKNAGGIWTPMNNGLPVHVTLNIWQLAVHEGYLYAENDLGIFRFENGYWDFAEEIYGGLFTDRTMLFQAGGRLYAGTARGLFSMPAAGGVVTRAQFTSMLVGLAGLEAGGAENFADVPEHSPCSEAIQTARALGIVSGVGGNMFLPDMPVARQDMFVMIYRAMVLMERMPAFQIDLWIEFDDWDDVAQFAHGPIQALAKLGLSTLRDGGVLLPNGTVLRAEAADVLARYLNFAPTGF